MWSFFVLTLIQSSMKKFYKNHRFITNLIIVCMLASLFLCTLNVKQQYTFNYENNEVLYHGNTDTNKICFMINVYWGNEYIKPILDVFDEYNVKTTFFVGGSWVNKYPELLKEIYRRGHEIGNHGFFHKDQDKLDYDGNYEEIDVCHKMVKSTIGIDMNLFAPPSGAFNSSTIKACNFLGYKTIMWTLDTIDWRDKDSDLIFNRATQKAKGGDFILAHTTEKTLEALPKILQFYSSNNLVATTVTDTLSV